MARAMRILRVFGTAKSLRRIVSPLVASLVPVANAFAILFVIMAFGPLPHHYHHHHHHLPSRLPSRLPSKPPAHYGVVISCGSGDRGPAHGPRS